MALKSKKKKLKKLNKRSKYKLNGGSARNQIRGTVYLTMLGATLLTYLSLPIGKFFRSIMPKSKPSDEKLVKIFSKTLRDTFKQILIEEKLVDKIKKGRRVKYDFENNEYNARMNHLLHDLIYGTREDVEKLHTYMPKPISGSELNTNKKMNEKCKEYLIILLRSPYIGLEYRRRPLITILDDAPPPPPDK